MLKQTVDSLLVSIKACFVKPLTVMHKKTNSKNFMQSVVNYSGSNTYFSAVTLLDWPSERASKL